MNFGVAKARLKKYREAEKCYFKSLEVQPGYAVCLNNLGNLVSILICRGFCEDRRSLITSVDKPRYI